MEMALTTENDITVELVQKLSSIKGLQHSTYVKLHSPPTSSVTAGAELFCWFKLIGENAIHWKVVPFQFEFVLITRIPVYRRGWVDMNSNSGGTELGINELSVIVVPSGV